MSVRVTAAALAELEDAADYLDGRDAGLGDDLYSELKAALDFIAEFPEASPKTALGYRRYNLKSFRYYLIYRLKNDEIFVGVFAHAHREQSYWRNRNFD